MYNKTPKGKRPPFMFVLDSLGLLSTTKELEDITEGKETRDMTLIFSVIFHVIPFSFGESRDDQRKKKEDTTIN